MEARLIHFVRTARVATILSLILIAFFTCSPVSEAQILRGRLAAVRPHQANSENFIVFASSPQWAKQVAEAAEHYRRELAIRWLGKELPAWPERCPIHVSAGPNLNASGETRFSPTQFGVGNWMMSVNGTPQRVLDSVLPHEISHTIFATHFARYAHQNRYVPRWADEGACTTVEHEAEKRKHRHYLEEFLQTGRGLAFNRMFVMKEYPSDILPLYAQGHSAVQFLIDQSSPRKFVQFLESGMADGRWESALREHYEYETIGEFQTMWNQWLYDGSPTELTSYAPALRNQVGAESVPAMLASSASQNSIAADLRQQPAVADADKDAFRNRQLKGKMRFAIRNTGPAPAQLAVQSQSASSNSSSGADSWYKRRLQEVNSGKIAASDLDQPTSRLGPAQGLALSSSAAGPSPASGSSAGRGSEAFVLPDKRMAEPANPKANNLSSWGDNVSTPASVPLAQNEGLDPEESPAAWDEPPTHLTLGSSSRSFDSNPRQQSYSTARQQGSESVQMQVLDWGNSTPRSVGSRMSVQAPSRYTPATVSSAAGQASPASRISPASKVSQSSNSMALRPLAAGNQAHSSALHSSISGRSTTPANRTSTLPAGHVGSVRMVPIQR